MVATRGLKITTGPLLYKDKVGIELLDSIMELAPEVVLTSKAGAQDNVESWMIEYANLRPNLPLSILAENLLRKVGGDMVERFAKKGRAIRVQLTRSCLRQGKVKPGKKNMRQLPVHRDGGKRDVILTSVLVWYTNKETGEVILDGRGSAEFGGGLNYGAGADGLMRRSGKTAHLVIPSGGVYVFPGSVVEHSVGEVTVHGIDRWSLVVFWDLRKKVDGTPTKAAFHKWWNSRTRSPAMIFCDKCQGVFATKSNFNRHQKTKVCQRRVQKMAA